MLRQVVAWTSIQICLLKLKRYYINTNIDILIRDTVTSFNLFIRYLGHVIEYIFFFVPKAQISTNMTAFGHPYLLCAFSTKKFKLRVPDHE